MSGTDGDLALTIGLRQHLFNLRMAIAAARFVPRIPRASLDDLFPGVGELTISLRHTMADRGLPPGEALVLSLITAYVQPQRVFEIGTATGAGTLLIAEQAPSAAIDTLDLGDNDPALGRQPGEPPMTDAGRIGNAFRQSEHAARITQHFGDSAQFEFPAAGTVDLVFVDGAHTFEYVRSDSRAALRMVRPGGTIVWDDCNFVCPGVSRALLQLRASGHQVYRIYGTRLALLRVRAATA